VLRLLHTSNMPKRSSPSLMKCANLANDKEKILESILIGKRRVRIQKNGTNPK
jgi:hypothetical protein